MVALSGPSLRKYSFVDLFAGPGGLTLGFKQSGFFQPIVGVESDTTVAQTYQKNLDVPVIRKDVENVHPHEILDTAFIMGFDHIDAIVGGPPCRPFTMANTGGTRWKAIKKREKYSDHPNWEGFCNIVNAIKPLFVVAENVMGFRNNTDVFLKFVNKLWSLGYTVGSRELDAQHFGIPQKRRRIFIVGLRGKGVDESSLLPNPKQFLRTVSVKEAISDLPALSNDNSNFKKSQYNLGRPTTFQCSMRNGQKEVCDHVVHLVHPAMAKRFEYIPQGYNLRRAWNEGKIPADVMQATYLKGRARRGFSSKTLQQIHSNIYRRLNWEQPSCTITHVRKTVLIHPLQNRLLSVREAARLQSFPDWYRFSGSISQQYQQIADAVPPLLAREVARHLVEGISLYHEPVPIKQPIEG